MNFVRRKSIKLRLCTVFCVLALASAASAGELLTNGGFESPFAPNWVVTDNTSDVSSWFRDSTTATPLSGYPTVGPFAGNFYAVTDQFSPGSHALSQTFTVPLGTTSAILAFEIFVNDIFAAGGQTARVDLQAAGQNPITGSVLHNFYSNDVFQSDPGTPNPWVPFSQDIIGFMTPGVSYQIRVLETDSSPFDVGVDGFSLNAVSNVVIPEPGMFFPVVLVAGIFVYRRRRSVRA